MVRSIVLNVTAMPLARPDAGDGEAETDSIRRITLMTPVARMLASEIGISHFQAIDLELILAKAGEGPTEPDHDEDQDADLGKENAGSEDVELRLAQARGPIAAEEQGGGDGREREHVGELGQEEEEKPKAAVLGDVTHHEFGLGDRHVEGNSGELGQRGDHEDGEPDELDDDEGHPQRPAVLREPVRLGVDDAGQRHRPRHDDHARQPPGSRAARRR